MLLGGDTVRRPADARTANISWIQSDYLDRTPLYLGGKRKDMANPLEYATTASTGSRVWHAAKRLLPFLMAGLLLLSLHRQLPSAATALKTARPMALISLLLFLGWNQMATLAWRGLLRATGVNAPSLGKLVRLRIEAQAVNQLVPAAGLAGEALRAVSVAEKDQMGAASLATLLDNAAGTASGLVLAAGALFLYAQAHGGHADLHTLLLTMIGALVVLLAVVALPVYLAPRAARHLSPTHRLRGVLDLFALNGRPIRVRLDAPWACASESASSRSARSMSSITPWGRPSR